MELRCYYPFPDILEFYELEKVEKSYEYKAYCHPADFPKLGDQMVNLSPYEIR